MEKKMPKRPRKKKSIFHLYRYFFSYWKSKMPDLSMTSLKVLVREHSFGKKKKITMGKLALLPSSVTSYSRIHWCLQETSYNKREIRSVMQTDLKWEKVKSDIPILQMWSVKGHRLGSVTSWGLQTAQGLLWLKWTKTWEGNFFAQKKTKSIEEEIGIAHCLEGGKGGIRRFPFF